MKESTILSKLKKRTITCEQALEYMAATGMSPNLMNDDNGHWALVFDGFQNVPMGSEPEDISSTVFIEADRWKNSVLEAMVYGLEKT